MLPQTNTEETTRDYNLPLYGQRGEYSLSGNVKVPYFISLIDLKRVTRELKTHEEVSPSFGNTYNLIELFQRNIDPNRVRKEIVDGYLRNPNKLKFFNSLTIVLLPKDSEGRIQQNFENYPNNDPGIPYQENDKFDAFFAGDMAKKFVFGGVQFVATKTASMSRLRWDCLHVDAVAVDGQHRLKALKIWMEGNNNELTEIARATRIPVIFLLLHETAGFISPPATNISIKSVAREIFTDLNKNAREVDLATQIILDDRSVASCCVRSLITPSTCEDDDELLPLSLLRWQDANPRFDQKHFLNSLVNLHLIVEDLVDLSPPTKDPMDVKKAREFINRASEQLGLDHPDTNQRELVADGITLRNYYEKHFVDEETGDTSAPLIGVPPPYLSAAVLGFTKHYSSWMLRVLRDFSPYAALIEYARDNDLITGRFSQYLTQPREHREQLQGLLQSEYGEQWEEELIGKHFRQIELLKGLRDKEHGEMWAFKTIFQKAFLRLAKTLFCDFPEAQQEMFGDIDMFLTFFNQLHASQFLRVKCPLPKHRYDVWTFLAVNYGNEKIKVTTTSEKRIEALLTIIYYVYRYASIQGKTLSHKTNSETQISIDEVFKNLNTKKHQSDWPSSFDHIQSLCKEFSKAATVEVCVDEDQRANWSDKDRLDYGKLRLKAILSVALSPFLDCESEQI